MYRTLYCSSRCVRYMYFDVILYRQSLEYCRIIYNDRVFLFAPPSGSLLPPKEIPNVVPSLQSTEKDLPRSCGRVSKTKRDKVNQGVCSAADIFVAGLCGAIITSTSEIQAGLVSMGSCTASRSITRGQPT